MRLIKRKTILPFILALIIAPCSVHPGVTGKDDTMNRLFTAHLCAQELQKPDKSAVQEKEARQDTSTTLYQVMGIVLIIWAGLAFFLFRLDRKVARLEKNINILT